tara:strand:- start:1334 stop:3586 length:2253 start_codon:yes stop_codon:yes gene_type:complete
MALTRITKGVIKPNEDYETRNVNATGIITATELDVNGNADISGDLSIQGVLTYEDVTSIDSVGIITAKKDVHVGAGLSVVGLSTFSNGVVVKTGTATTALIVEGNARVTGILTVGTGSLTITDRDINAVGVVTGSNFKTGTSNVHNVGIEVAQINVLGGPTKIGAGLTITNEGNFQSIGISTALQFKTGTTNVHNVGIEVAQLNVLGGATKIGSGATIYADGGFESIGVATATNFKTGTSNLHNVGIELAGINVLGADTPIGLGATVFNTGDIVSKSGAEFQGIVTATSFVGDGLNLTNTGSSLSEPGSGTHRLVTTSLTSGTMTSSGTDSTLTFDYATHTLSATNFSGNGAGLSNTGSALSEPSSGTHRLVTTSLTSGTMTSSGTDSTLTFNFATNTLSATNFSGNGSGLSSLNASNISSGTINAARVPTLNQNTTGSAATLTTARTINGVSFNGSANITTLTAGTGVSVSGTQVSIGQAVASSDAPTFANIYNDGWFRSNDSGDGLYNQATNQHWYSDSANYWNMGSGQGSGGIRFRDNHNSTIRGYVYFNNSNQIGFLNESGTWSFRAASDGTISFHDNKFSLGQANSNYNIKVSQTYTGSGGISHFDGSNNHLYQLYGTSGGEYGFLDANWASWDIQKVKNGAFKVDEGSGLKRVLNEANYTSYISAASVLYIDVYGQGNAQNRNTANSWAQSAVSIPNNTIYLVRFNNQYSYWVNNNTATGNEDRKALFIKNASGSIYWAGVDTT